jgi:cell division septation protein DedD
VKRSQWLRLILLVVLCEVVCGCQPKSKSAPSKSPSAPDQPKTLPSVVNETPRFAVQVGAFEHRARADALSVRLADRYKKPVLTVPTLSDNRTLYRVRILVGTRAEADALALILSRNEKLETWIVPLRHNPRPRRQLPRSLIPSQSSTPSTGLR